MPHCVVTVGLPLYDHIQRCTSFLYKVKLMMMAIHVPVYATTGGSPYVYRNFMVCTQRMGDNEMRRPRVIGHAY